MNNLTTPKTVAFDLGKVLVDFDYAIAARRIAARGNMSLLDLARYFSHSPIFVEYESGRLSTEQFYEEVRHITGFRGSLAEFGHCFADIFVPIQPMVELHERLRERGLTTYAFSNTNELAAEHIRRSFPFYSTFDGHILSYEHGVMKPDARLYEIVERESGRHGADILYLDDRPENVEAGAARGWQVILQETPAKSRAAVEKLGLLNHA